MAIVPASPRATSAQRGALTRWCSHSAATRVTHSGVAATMAVNSASGRCWMLMNPNRLVAANSTARSAWNRGCVVRSTATPSRCSTNTVVSSAWNR